MNPILIKIRRKTRVPTKNQIQHMYRSDWKIVGSISYADSMKIFKSIGGGPIERDSQFAKLLYQNYGPGSYSLIAWRKGREGFWSFWTVELDHSFWRRLPKENSKREKELKEYKQETARVKNQLKTEDNPKERESLNEELNFLKEVYEVEPDEEGKKNKRGPSPYIKQTLPIYKTHAYENYGQTKDREVEVNDYW